MLAEARVWRGGLKNRAPWSREPSPALAERELADGSGQRIAAPDGKDLVWSPGSEQAQLNLSYTVVTADQPGRVVQLSAAVGQYAQPGANLSMFMPDDIWI